LAGTILIVGGDLGGSSLTGDVLALAGGIAGGGYAMAGQASRKTLGILEYAVVTYAVAAVLLFFACLVKGDSFSGYGGGTWIALAALVLGPQLLGHTGINYVLKEIDATTVSVAIMAEPVIATALAFLLFAETPSLLVYPGGFAVLLGIYLTTSVARSPVPAFE
jgi:drug/metabolite transporter (DMT)-like permease